MTTRKKRTYALRLALFLFASLICWFPSKMFSVVPITVLPILSISRLCSKTFSVNNSCNSAIFTTLLSTCWTWNSERQRVRDSLKKRKQSVKLKIFSWVFHLHLLECLFSFKSLSRDHYLKIEQYCCWHSHVNQTQWQTSY